MLPKDILKKARKANGLTQAALAEKIGTTLRVYQHLEAGRFPKYNTGMVKNIDSVLGTRIYEKIYPEQEINDPILAEILKELRIQTALLKQIAGINPGKVIKLKNKQVHSP